MLQFYITSSFCVDIDHFNAKCRKLFLYIYIFCCFCCCFFFCCCFLHFASATCRNVFVYLLFYILRCNIPTVRKHHFRQHLIWNFHENQTPFFAFFADSDTWVGLPGWYRESIWNEPLMCRRFQQSNVHLVIKCRCIWDKLYLYFSRVVYDLFSMCFVLHVLTINDFFLFVFFINIHWDAWLFFSCHYLR